MPKLTKAAVREALQSETRGVLEGAGFVSGSRNWPAVRTLERRVEIVDVLFADVKGAAPPGLSKVSFRWEIGVFLRNFPDPFGARVNEHSLPAGNTVGCHFRLYVSPPRLLSGLRDRGFWFVDEAGWLSRPVIKSARALLEEQVLPWFGRFEDLSCVLDDLVASGNQHKLSSRALQTVNAPDLVTGLLALEIGRWSDAERFLSRAATLENPVHAVDPKAPKLIYHFAMDEIQNGLAQARAK